MSFPLESLTVYQLPQKKIRVGKDFDGGYIILDGFQYDLFIGCGISRDDSFENAFIKKYPIPAFAFDGSINDIPSKNRKIKFYKKNISDKNNANETNLHDLIKNYNNIFLKMDIEGGEFPWFDSLTDDQLKKFRQITIEFHRPFVAEKWKILERLAKTHWLCHIHPNNCCAITQFNGVGVPNVFECTYIRKSDVKGTPSKSTDPIPGPLDMPNIRSKPQHTLKGYPYNV